MMLWEFLQLLRKTEYLVLASDSGEILEFGFDPLDVKDPEGSLGSSGLFIVLKRPED